MKSIHILLSLGLALVFSLQTSAQTPGITGKGPFSMETSTSEIFGSKKRQEARERNERLQSQNERFRDQIRRLETSLERCAGTQTRRRLPSRKLTPTRATGSQFIGERKLDREYEQLMDENRFLRSERDWLMNEVRDCREARERAKNRDRYDRGKDRSDDCCCDGRSKSKGKGKKKKRYDD